MSCASPPNCACPTPVTTNVPGSPGENGTNGTNGTNAFTTTTANFIVPSLNSSVGITVANSAWMTVGQIVFIQNAGFFSVNSVSSSTAATVTYLNYQGFAGNAGNTINSGAQISPAGTQPSFTSPLPIANGGTDATTVSAAQSNLGLGQNGTEAHVSGLSQSLTTSATLIAGATVTVPATGLYMIMAQATVELRGVTFSPSETITVTAVDTTSSTTLSTALATTGQPTTTDFPSCQYAVPPVTANLTNADVLQVQIEISATPSAGTANAASADLIIIPLAL